MQSPQISLGVRRGEKESLGLLCTRYGRCDGREYGNAGPNDHFRPPVESWLIAGAAARLASESAGPEVDSGARRGDAPALDA